MTDFGLANPVDAAEALLQPVRVPGQVVVDHQVGALQVDAFARGVGCQEHLHLRVVPERFLHRQPFLAAHAAMNDDDRLLTAEQSRDALPQVPQRVPVLGEEHEVLPRGGPRTRDLAGAVRDLRLPDTTHQPRRREDLTEHACELAPLRVPARAAYVDRERF